MVFMEMESYRIPQLIVIVLTDFIKIGVNFDRKLCDTQTRHNGRSPLNTSLRDFRCFSGVSKIRKYSRIGR